MKLRPNVAIGAMCAVWCAIAILRGQQSAPDLILTNGKIITVDDRFSIARAVAIKSDRIVAVGSSREIARLTGAQTRTIDLAGKVVIPGLIDNHGHFMRAGETWDREVRWDGVESRKQALDMLRARVRAVTPGEWVFTLGGWTHDQFADDRTAFSRAELDRVAPDNPVLLQEAYYRSFPRKQSGLDPGGQAGRRAHARSGLLDNTCRPNQGRQTGPDDSWGENRL